MTCNARQNLLAQQATDIPGRLAGRCSAITQHAARACLHAYNRDHVWRGGDLPMHACMPTSRFMFDQAKTCLCQLIALAPLHKAACSPRTQAGQWSNDAQCAELCPRQQTALQHAKPGFQSEGLTTGPP